MAEFGRQLRQSRQAAALSLRQLAARVGYDHSYLSQVERGCRPGSAHLAELCDRALGTGTALTATFRQMRPSTPRSTAPPAEPVPLSAAAAERVPPPAAVDVDLLEAARHELAGSFGRSRPDEWRLVVAGHTAAFATTPPAVRLPLLTADLRLLQTSPRPQELAVPAAELAVLTALTLAALGRGRAAGRWWSTARAAADSAGEAGIGGRVRAWEAWSGPTESRGLPDLLDLASDALSSAVEPQDRARASAARARVLALLNQSGQARQELHDLHETAAALEATTSPFGWPAYEVERVASFVFTVLGDTRSAYLAQDRALAACPLEHRRERAELELHTAECLVRDGEVAVGLATAMRVLVELEDQWHTQDLYDAAGRVLSAVQGPDAGRPAVRDFRELLKRRPYGRSVGSGSSAAGTQE